MRKKFHKWFLAIFICILGVFGFAACTSCSSAKDVAFEFSKEVPSSVQIYDEIYFKEYLKDEEGAKYTLYVSYTSPATGTAVTNQKQPTLVYTFNECATYTIKIERVLNEKTKTLSCEIEVLPPAPTFSAVDEVLVNKDDTRTLEEILTAADCSVSPFDLQDDIRVVSLKMLPMTYLTTDTTIDLTEKEISLTEGQSSFTFDKEAVYTFTLEAENVSGKATAQVVVKSYNVAHSTQKVELNYEAEDFLASWNGLEGATGYRVWVDDGSYTDSAQNEFDFTGYSDGAYELHVVPIYGTTIYPDSELTKSLYVGRDHSAIELTVGANTVSFEKRYFTSTYTVVENGIEYTYTAQNEVNGILTHTLQGTYTTDDEITVSVVANFDNGTKTEKSEKTFLYGLATLNKMDIFASNRTVKAFDGIESVVFDHSGDTFFMVEFTGKNAPNFAVGAKKVVSNLTLASGTSEWIDAGLMMWNSLIGNRRWGLHVTNGFHSGGGSIDLRDNYIIGEEGKGPGLENFDDDTKYIMIVGYQKTATQELPYHGTVSVKIFTISEEGTLALAFEKSEGYNTVNHVPVGTKAVIYGNTTQEEGDSYSPDSVSFKYWTPASNLNDLINGMKDTNAYKAQLKEILGVPDAPEFNPLSKTAKLTKMDIWDTTQKGYVKAASGIETVSFDHSGDTFFIVEFKGKNAPNFAVGANAALSEITLANGATEWTDAGVMLWNSWINDSWGSLYVTRGFHGGSNAQADKVGEMAGSKGNGPGFYFFDDNTDYVMIVGYETVAGSTRYEGKVSYKIFTVNAEKQLTLVAEAEQVFAYTAHVAVGGKAVIYPNVAISASTADTDEISFRYEAPASTLAALVNGLAENCTYKTQLLTLCGITPQA